MWSTCWAVCVPVYITACRSSIGFKPLNLRSRNKTKVYKIMVLAQKSFSIMLKNFHCHAAITEMATSTRPPNIDFVILCPTSFVLLLCSHHNYYGSWRSADCKTLQWILQSCFAPSMTASPRQMNMSSVLRLISPVTAFDTVPVSESPCTHVSAGLWLERRKSNLMRMKCPLRTWHGEGFNVMSVTATLQYGSCVPIHLLHDDDRI